MNRQNKQPVTLASEDYEKHHAFADELTEVESVYVASQGIKKSIAKHKVKKAQSKLNDQLETSVSLYGIAGKYNGDLVDNARLEDYERDIEKATTEASEMFSRAYEVFNQEVLTNQSDYENVSSIYDFLSNLEDHEAFPFVNYNRDNGVVQIEGYSFELDPAPTMSRRYSDLYPVAVPIMTEIKKTDNGYDVSFYNREEIPKNSDKSTIAPIIPDLEDHGTADENYRRELYSYCLRKKSAHTTVDVNDEFKIKIIVEKDKSIVAKNHNYSRLKDIEGLRAYRRGDTEPIDLDTDSYEVIRNDRLRNVVLRNLKNLPFGIIDLL